MEFSEFSERLFSFYQAGLFLSGGRGEGVEGGGSILDALTLEKLEVKTHSCAALLDFIALFS